MYKWPPQKAPKRSEINHLPLASLWTHPKKDSLNLMADTAQLNADGQLEVNKRAKEKRMHWTHLNAFRRCHVTWLTWKIKDKWKMEIVWCSGAERQLSQISAWKIYCTVPLILHVHTPELLHVSKEEQTEESRWGKHFWVWSKLSTNSRHAQYLLEKLVKLN